jgi:UDP-N-acetylmuramoyl-tripeptide--D-alanyl-D-alanine ligase
VIPLPREIAEPLGELRGGSDAFTGVTADSRAAGPGDLFVAVRGGVAYVDDALAAGAAALVPHDAHTALATLARAVRERSRARVVAITGSVGKTSTKDILAGLSTPVAGTVAAEHGYNNEIGLPLTLCRIDPDTEVVILEMGTRGLGQIATLCEIAQPDVAVVTAIGPVHLELLGTIENIVRAKSELVLALPPGGTAVVPAELAVERDDVEVVRMGEDVRLVRCEGGECEVEWSDGTRVALTLPTTARHHGENAVAALAAYRALGLPLERAPANASGIRFSRWRGEELPLAGGGLLINDAWNANPPAMLASLAHFVACAGNRRRVAVLGYMAELGPDAPRYHEEVGRLASEAGVDVLIAVGEPARAYLGGGVPETHWAPDAEAAARILEEVMRPGDCVLVKASRAVGLERLAEAAGLVTA